MDLVPCTVPQPIGLLGLHAHERVALAHINVIEMSFSILSMGVMSVLDFQKRDLATSTCAPLIALLRHSTIGANALKAVVVVTKRANEKLPKILITVAASAHAS